jgi:hypothetical protein
VATILAVALMNLPNGMGRGLPALARLGYGAVDGCVMINGRGDESVISSAVLANTPQVLLSFLYFSYNALFTAMLGGVEWASYACKRKGPRVSRVPCGDQRSTYFLQLPYRFTIPLVFLSGFLHWLVSQSIFLVAIDFYDAFDNSWGGGFGLPSIKTCGFSPIAILSAMIFGIIMFITIVGFAYVPYKHGMALVGNCSMAISAACHPGDHVDGSIVAAQKVQGHVVAASDDMVRHCTFTAEEVEGLIVGGTCAGKLREM